MAAAPQMMVNSRGNPVGEQLDLVIFLEAQYVGEQVSGELNAGSVETAILYLDWTATGGASNLDVVIETQNPATKKWLDYVTFAGVATAVGLVVMVLDPVAVQADYDTTKTRVKRVRIPNRCRIRVRPGNQLPQTYSLGLTANLGL